MRRLVSTVLPRQAGFLASFLLSFSLVVSCSSAFSQDRDISARLARIKTNVSATEATLVGVKEEFSKLKKEERGLEAEIQKLTFEEQALVERSAQVVKDREALAGQVKIAEERVDIQRKKLRDRLRVLYVNTLMPDQSHLVTSIRSSDVERIALYMKAIRRDDERHFSEVKLAVETLIDVRRRLDGVLDESKRLHRELQERRREVESRRAKLKIVLQQLQEKQERAKATLALLTRDASKLEDILKSITGGSSSAETAPTEDRSDEVPPTVASPAAQRDQAAGDAAIESKPREGLHPDGLFGKSVTIAYPVKGDVVQRFGRTKVTNFSDMIFSKGFEYKTAEGSQVRAVLSGQVVFSGAMPGYDTVVIIDHGARSYSLYGRLGKSFVRKGDLINQRDAIGITSAPDAKGRNFYFETRKNGSPVDPTVVLSRAS